MRHAAAASLLCSFVFTLVASPADARRPRPARVEAARETPEWATYEAECGGCHLAFPPRMLPARSWTALLAGLADHFGSNAEVSPQARAVLEPWLAGHARTKPVVGTPLRITELPFWRHEHDELRPEVFARRSVTSPANCAACHPRANRGAFGEHEVRIPRDAPPPR